MKSTEICLVLKHLEGVSSEIFQKYHDVISDHVSGLPGVYALYSNGSLYYVGLASDMRGRLKTHLKDIHAKRWDRFSAYLTDGGKHLKELEALLIGIAKPKGNSVHGHFPRSENILPRLKKAIAQHDKEKMNEMLGIFSRHPRPVAQKTAKEKPAKPSKALNSRKSTKPVHPAQQKIPKLASVKAPKSLVLYAHYKGTPYTAHAFPDGTVRIGDQEYGSLSLAGVTITKQTTCNGWRFWRGRGSNGEWMFVDDLRKKGEWPFQTSEKKKPAKSAETKNSSLKPTESDGKARKLVSQYKGKTYRAILCPDGKVRMDGKWYGSLSGAAEVVTGHATSGPAFWKFKI